MCRLAMSAVILALTGVGPALAESQSSNSSSNCSNGRCTRVESFITGDGRFTRGYFRQEAWREDHGRWWKDRQHVPRERRDRGERRGRDDDDDD